MGLVFELKQTRWRAEGWKSVLNCLLWNLVAGRSYVLCSETMKNARHMIVSCRTLSVAPDRLAVYINKTCSLFIPQNIPICSPPSLKRHLNIYHYQYLNLQDHLVYENEGLQYNHRRCPCCFWCFCSKGYRQEPLQIDYLRPVISL